MSLFKKPSELNAKPGIVAMIYGQPGSGKSTLGCSAPNAVLIDADGGALRVNGAHMIPTLQVEKWEDIVAAMNEVRNTPQIQSVVIDTVGKMMSYIEEYIIRTASGKRVEVDRSGGLSLKGFGVRKKIFVDFIKNITTLGKNVIFIAHDKEEKRGDETIIRPEVGGSSAADLMKELDLVGYMELNGNIRTISFTPTDRYYAKNTCDMEGVISPPVLINENKEPVGTNDFMCKVINHYHNRMADSLDKNRKLEELRSLIEVNVAEANDLESVNRTYEWMLGLEHVYNSKAIAWAAILNKAKSLGLVYEKSSNKFVESANTSIGKKS